MSPPVILKRYVRRPRAFVGKTLGGQEVAGTIAILEEFGKLTLDEFMDVYNHKYPDCLDVTTFDDGIRGYFKQLDHMINLQTNNDGTLTCSLSPNVSKPAKVIRSNNILRSNLYVSNSNRTDENNDSNSNCSSDLGYDSSHPEGGVKQKIYQPKSGIHSEHHGIFDSSNTLLWTLTGKQFNKLLMKGTKDLVIPLSPYELAMKQNFRKVVHMKELIKKQFARYPDGMPLSQVGTIVRIDKKLFNATSYAQVIEENPELFYIRSIYGSVEEEAIVYDGFNHSYEDYMDKGRSTDYSDYYLCHQYVLRSIRCGIYQMTVLLVEKAQPDGLKLGVWKQALIINFKPNNEDEDVPKILEMRPLDYFLALKKFGLIDLRPNVHCKNDIRICLPDEYIDCVECIMKIATQMKSQREREGKRFSKTTILDNVENIYS